MTSGRFVALGALVFLSGCLPALEDDCKNDNDCLNGTCNAGVCVQLAADVNVLDTGQTPDVGPRADGAIPDAAKPDAAVVKGDVGPQPDACAPLPETCDLADNDCDGEIDEGLNPGEPLIEDCYTAARGLGVGECRKGRSTCTAAGPGLCAGEITPVDEECNGRDDDCDNIADETIEPIDCYEGPEGTQGVGTCAGGQMTCVDGRMTACTGQVLPTPEICDQIDNDCDTEVDDEAELGVGACDCEANEDGEAVAAQSCYGGPQETQNTGACRPGTQTCSDGTLGPCIDQVTPQPETCNQIDDDCDGIADEQLGNAPCTVGRGNCAADGLTQCGPQGEVCSAQPGEPSVEICNGQDDDCNGTADDGLNVGQPCTNGRGTCAGQGLIVCQPDTGMAVCNGVEGAANDEICNGLDDDCDGSIDNGDIRVPCFTGAYEPVGACRRGTQACSAGEPDGECVDEILRTEDVMCDGIDADCDGTVDEGACDGGCENGTTTECYDGPPGTAGVGVCTAGRRTCSNREYGPCVGQNGPAEETCNGFDDDCNGNVDDNLGNGPACSVGEGACRVDSFERCVDGDMICGGQPGASSPELCNGIDDDCDGEIDNNTQGSGVGCFDDRCPVEGSLQCAAGTTLRCMVDASDAQEVCNGVDDDCDDSVDETAQCPPTPNASGECASGACRVICDRTWFNLDENQDNGCEAGCLPFVPAVEVQRGAVRIAVRRDGVWAVARVSGVGALTLQTATGSVPIANGVTPESVSIGFNDIEWVVAAQVNNNLRVWTIRLDLAAPVLIPIDEDDPGRPLVVSRRDGQAAVYFMATFGSLIAPRREVLGMVIRTNGEAPALRSVNSDFGWSFSTDLGLAGVDGPQGTYLLAYNTGLANARWKILQVTNELEDTEVASFARDGQSPVGTPSLALSDSQLMALFFRPNGAYFRRFGVEDDGTLDASDSTSEVVAGVRGAVIPTTSGFSFVTQPSVRSQPCNLTAYSAGNDAVGRRGYGEGGCFSVDAAASPEGAHTAMVRIPDDDVVVGGIALDICQ